MFTFHSQLAKIIIIGLLCCVTSQAKNISSSSLTNQGKCQCGSFFKLDPNAIIFSHTPMNTSCDQYGRNKCLTMCIDLIAINNRASKLICKRMDHADALKPFLFSRVCLQDWAYTNVTSEKPICCKFGAPIAC